jgi:hypothetical protein
MKVATETMPCNDPAMGLDEKIACMINVVFGAGIGFVIYFFPLGGFGPLLTSRGGRWWNGSGAFWICVGGGALIGFVSYKNRLRNLDIEPRGDGIYSGQAGQELLWRRIAMLIFGVVAVYFIWQLAKGIWRRRSATVAELTMRKRRKARALQDASEF